MNNDLISREAVKEEIRNNKKVAGRFIEGVIMLIDNAPTVELTELCKGCQYLKDCETCDKNERPQGEWVVDAGGYQCNKCFAHALEINGIEIRSNFCPNCGADMRKGGADNDVR